MEFGHEPHPAVEPLHQAMLEGFLVGGQATGGQQGPIDGADAGIRAEVHTGFVAHTGAILALGE